MAWECPCLFINPEAAAICFWCDKPRDEYKQLINKDKDNGHSTVPQEGVVTEKSAVTAVAADTPAGRAGTDTVT
ncbi:Protein of unknown function [Pyronema omphalodes CBS 100304]|uniref:RanBP2-type domain-containing protein n=1 Tax=Pyronema omphalodes (strain CBS 100304) TaxID=1076935 RepID=U4LEK0_PYROM|nr:Protein of unknown function [Pyronema omphalodes CBS 100304]